MGEAVIAIGRSFQHVDRLIVNLEKLKSGARTLVPGRGRELGEGRRNITHSQKHCASVQTPTKTVETPSSENHLRGHIRPAYVRINHARVPYSELNRIDGIEPHHVAGVVPGGAARQPRSGARFCCACGTDVETSQDNMIDRLRAQTNYP